MDLVDFIATSTVDDSIIKMNVLRLVDGFFKFLQVSSHCNVPRIYDVLEVGVFARTDLTETYNVFCNSSILFVFNEAVETALSATLLTGTFRCYSGI